MKRNFLIVAAVGLALVLPAASVEAQRPVNVGILAGASMPTGDAGDFLNTGFNIGATLGFQPAMLPVGVRVDGIYNSFDGDDDAELSVLSVTANASFTIPMASMPMISPYLIGGLGLYSADAGGDSDRENEFGWNIGGGLRFNLAGFSTFVEARYNSFSVGEGVEELDVTYVPISFGIMF